MKLITGLLFLLLSLICEAGFAQDVIYRRNGEVLKVTNLSPAGKSRSYRLPDDAPGVVRYISVSAIDSIVYENGTRDVFSAAVPIIPMAAEESGKSFRRSYVATDFSSLFFYHNLQISYEYLPGKGRAGYFITLAKNLDPFRITEYRDYNNYNNYQSDYYSAIIRYMNSSLRLGTNVYIFPPGIFRISAGLSWISGRYDKEIIEYLSQEPYMRTTVAKNQKVNGILFSPALNYQPFDFLQVRMGVDLPVVATSGFNTGMFRLEFAFNLE